MARNRAVKNIQNINRLNEYHRIQRALHAQYDPAIMDEMLNYPMMRNVIPELNTADEERLKLIKGIAVIDGQYQQYVEFRKKLLADGGVITWGKNNNLKGGE